MTSRVLGARDSFKFGSVGTKCGTEYERVAEMEKLVHYINVEDKWQSLLFCCSFFSGCNGKQNVWLAN